MVRIYTRIMKKRYLSQKQVYTHMYVAIPIPSRFHELLQPFLGKDLKITIDAHTDTLAIALTPKPNSPQKHLFTKKTHPQKQEENTQESNSSNGKTQNLLKYPPEETFSD